MEQVGQKKSSLECETEKKKLLINAKEKKIAFFISVRSKNFYNSKVFASDKKNEKFQERTKFQMKSEENICWPREH